MYISICNISCYNIIRPIPLKHDLYSHNQTINFKFSGPPVGPEKSFRSLRSRIRASISICVILILLSMLQSLAISVVTLTAYM